MFLGMFLHNALWNMLWSRKIVSMSEKRNTDKKQSRLVIIHLETRMRHLFCPQYFTHRGGIRKGEQEVIGRRSSTGPRFVVIITFTLQKRGELRGVWWGTTNK